MIYYIDPREVDTAQVGVDAVLLVDGQRVLGLADPTGGTFDAAGDFDRLPPMDRNAFPTLSRIDLEGTTEFSSSEVASIVDEADRALALTGQTRSAVAFLGSEALHLMARDGRRRAFALPAIDRSLQARVIAAEQRDCLGATDG